MKKQHRINACAAVIILAGIAMAAGWALFLPMFLSPDEDTHYDYALTLYSAGRPMRPAENMVGLDTHPDVEYLVRETHARQQRLDANVGSEPGYGTSAYYRRLDAGAPKLAYSDYRHKHIDPVPYISRLYPIGYYALAALAIGIGDRVTHGSAVGMFFAVRYLSVILFACTLTFSWLALREAALGAKRSLLILAGVALFPMNAAMAGYVQPDNLAAALIAILMYLALRLRKAPTSVWLAVLSGVTFAALIATKRHYFTAMFVAVAALLLVRLPYRTKPLATWRAIALIGIPSLLAYVVTEAMIVPDPGGAGVCRLKDAYTFANQHGFAETTTYLLTGFGSAVTESFFDSYPYRTFWLNYTAHFTRHVVLGNESITSAAQRTLPFMSGIVALAFLLRIPRVRYRLFRIAKERSWHAAAKVATSNVLVNGYLCFFVILFAFKAYAGGIIPVQGRYWFPFLPGIWICAAILAPRLFPYRLSGRLGGAMLWALALFCVISSASTLPSIRKAFYQPLKAVPDRDHIYALVAVHPKASVLFVEGTMIDLRRASGVQDVVLRLDGASAPPVRRVKRENVVCGAEKTLLNTGFEANLDMSTLRRGKHELAFFVRTPWSPTLVDTAVRKTFEVRR